ncbi:uncharacterized protein MELLADRAFT_102782 [Melampsora larici-populina 98AG31]|uniref:Uncharacterized protein n=1 Tax=Melampsora larici-populina (strain 98AG31 / pathotype 3-4-7) TaxID=747676 RepID=F4R9C7_MELLP|nr:uncharacterized protein MELLADRAFT_102782 [Melampsora larici-populina 98AG31]EGG11179.1 hypothetical protein MELLADRAFT_102782 [Melampsora larici-populina 98AG31]
MSYGNKFPTSIGALKSNVRMGYCLKGRLRESTTTTSKESRIMSFMQKKMSSVAHKRRILTYATLSISGGMSWNQETNNNNLEGIKTYEVYMHKNRDVIDRS